MSHHRCCCGDASQCCDQSGGTCGLTRSAAPWVTLEASNISIAQDSDVYCPGTPCTKSVWSEWANLFNSASVDFPLGAPACGSASQFYEDILSYASTGYCDGVAENATRFQNVQGRYSLRTAVGFSAPFALGYSDYNDAVIGSALTPPSPSIRGQLTFTRYRRNIGTYGGELAACISLVDPTKWWIWHNGIATGKKTTGTTSLSGSVTTPGGCVASMSVSATIDQESVWECGGVDYDVVGRTVLAFDLLFDGIGACAGGPLAISGGGGSGSVGASPAAMDPRARNTLLRQTEPCVGCG